MKYVPMPGYARVTLDEKTLERWRTGRSPANPAEAQALVRELDRLWRVRALAGDRFDEAEIKAAESEE